MYYVLWMGGMVWSGVKNRWNGWVDKERGCTSRGWCEGSTAWWGSGGVGEARGEGTAWELTWAATRRAFSLFTFSHVGGYADRESEIRNEVVVEIAGENHVDTGTVDATEGTTVHCVVGVSSSRREKSGQEGTDARTEIPACGTEAVISRKRFEMIPTREQYRMPLDYYSNLGMLQLPVLPEPRSAKIRQDPATIPHVTSEASARAQARFAPGRIFDHFDWRLLFPSQYQPID